LVEQKNVLDNQEYTEAYRKRRRGCIFSIMGAWMGLLLLILLGMYLVRDQIVSREPDVIIKASAKYVEWDVPERFKPYSMTTLFGKTVLAYWDTEHIREDGRSLSVISLFADASWNERSLEDIESEFKKEAAERLNENDFHVLSEEIITWETRGQEYHFTVYSGRQRIGEKLLDGTSCYFFLKTDSNTFQVYTLGIESAFTREDQINFLKTVSPPPRGHKKNE